MKFSSFVLKHSVSASELFPVGNEVLYSLEKLDDISEMLFRISYCSAFKIHSCEYQIHNKTPINKAHSIAPFKARVKHLNILI